MLSEREIEIIIETFKPHAPLKIGLFGSTARNEETKHSDVDILYKLKNPVSLFTIAGIKIELEEKLNKKVDVVPLDSLYQELKPAIISDLKVLYAAA